MLKELEQETSVKASGWFSARALSDFEPCPTRDDKPQRAELLLEKLHDRTRRDWVRTITILQPARCEVDGSGDRDDASDR